MELRIVLVFMLCICIIDGRKLLMMLVDGFRWDYFNFPGLQLKGFPRLIRDGVKADYMIPDFPTNSFPNYKTIETGLHVENHGFVGNFMYDEKTKHKFHLELVDDDSLDALWWNKTEPFYITAEKQKLKTALYYWRGCQVDINGIKPTFCIPHTTKPNKKDIQRAIKDGIHRLKHDQADIVYIYHEQVDAKGHLYGPNSAEVLEAIVSVDDDINTMLDTLHNNGLDDVDVIILSDHGMASIDKLHEVNLTRAIDMDDIQDITEGGTQAYIWPKEGREEKVYEALKSYSSHIDVYYRSEIKDRWFFKKHRLVPPIFVHAAPGWCLVHPKSRDIYHESTGRLWQGNHGFDNNLEDMRSIFLAKGQDFKKDFKAQHFPNVNVYQIICHVTGIKPRPHNGTWSLVQDMLTTDSDTHAEL